MEDKVHRGAKVIIEVPEGCMIVFTSDTFHAGVKSYAKCRLFAYIIEDIYCSIDESKETISRTIECDTNCTICDSLINDNIHY